METINNIMKAVYINQCGSVDEIIYGDIPVPKCGDNDILIKTTAVAVDPVDVFVRSGQFETNTPFPFVIGRDVMGSVVAIGRGVSNFNIGDQVWSNSLGHNGRQGSFSEFVVCHEERAYPVPENVDYMNLISMVHPATTAYLALITHAQIKPNNIVLISGGAGNVGGAAIEIAVNAGANVIATAKPEDFEYCLKLGANYVIDYNHQNLEEGIFKLAPHGVDVYFDTSGRYNLNVATEILKKRGKIIIIAGISNISTLPMGKLYTKDINLIGFVISNATVFELEEAAMYVNSMMSKGKLKAKSIEIKKLSNAKQEHINMELKNHKQSRTVLIP